VGADGNSGGYRWCRRVDGAIEGVTFSVSDVSGDQGLQKEEESGTR